MSGETKRSRRHRQRPKQVSDGTCQHNKLCVNPSCAQCFPGLSVSSSSNSKSDETWNSSIPLPLPGKSNLQRRESDDLIELPIILCSRNGVEKQAIQVIRCHRNDLLVDIRKLLTQTKKNDTYLPQKFSFLKQVGGRILKLSRNQESGIRGYKAKHFASPQQKYQLRICDDGDDTDYLMHQSAQIAHQNSRGVIEFCVRHMMPDDNQHGETSSSILGVIRLHQDLSMSEIRDQIALQLPASPAKTGRFVRMLQGDVTLITLEQESQSCKNPLYAYHFAPPYTSKTELILMTSKSYREGEIVQDETKNRELKSLAFPLSKQGKNPRDVVKDKVATYINAFLNSSGGVLIFGANDDGVIERVPVSGKNDKSEMNLVDRVKLARYAKDDIRKLVDGKARGMDPIVDDDLVTTQFVPIRRQGDESSISDDHTRDAEEEIYCAIEVHVKAGRRSVYFMDRNSFDAYERRDGSTFIMEKTTIMQSLNATAARRSSDISTSYDAWHGGWRQLQLPFNFDGLMRRLSDPWAGREWLFAAVRRSLFEMVPTDPKSSTSDCCGVGVIGSRGMGKTSFLSELALRPKHASGLEIVAHHLCRSDDPDTLNPALFVHSIAAMLSRRCKDYRSLMVESSTDNSSDQMGDSMLRALHLEHCESDPDDAFLRGVIEPLRFIETRRGESKSKQSVSLPVVVVVDALDECLALTADRRPGRSGSITVAHLLERFVSSGQKFPSWVKLVVSFRSETMDVPGPIRRLTGKLQIIDLDLDGGEDAKLRKRAQNDIRLFVQAYIERTGMTSSGGEKGSGRWDFVKAAAFAGKLAIESGRDIIEWDFETEPGRWVAFDEIQNVDLLHARNIGATDCTFSRGKDTLVADLIKGLQRSLKSGKEQSIRLMKITLTGERIPFSPAVTETSHDRAYVNAESEFLDTFASNSQGNYLYARTVLEDVRSGRLQWDSITSLPCGLDHLYDSFFTRYYKGKNMDTNTPSVRVVEPVLEVLLAASNSGVTERDVVHAVVSGGACDPTAVAFCLRDIQWALDVDTSRDRVRFHLRHESIRSFLRDGDGTRVLRCKEENGHMLLAASLLQRCWPHQTTLSKWLQSHRISDKGPTPVAPPGSSSDWYNWLDWAPNAEDGDVYDLALHLSRSNAGSEEERIALLQTIGKDLLDSVTKGKGTALHGAAFAGNAPVVKLLLGANASPNIVVRGRCPLHYAAAKGFSTTVSLLLSSGANVGVATPTGRTPLLCAASRGSPKTVKIILEAIKNIANSRGQELEAAEAAMSLLNSSLVENGRTSLSVAAEEGHDEVIELLLEAGASVTLADRSGRTPIFYAARFGRLGAETIKALAQASGGNDALEWGDAVHLWSPLHTAVWHGHVQVVQSLLDANASPSIVDSEGKSALHEAACLGSYGHQMSRKKSGQSSRQDEETKRLDIVRLLLESRRCRVNQGDAYGCTPLWYAVAGGWTMAVEALLDHGTSFDPGDLPSLPNKARRGPASLLLLAIKRQHYGTATYLIGRGAKLPLHYEIDTLCNTPGFPSDFITVLRHSAMAESKSNVQPNAEHISSVDDIIDFSMAVKCKAVLDGEFATR
jgi:ankyrin repeat protein